jgi:hypothetical protein
MRLLSPRVLPGWTLTRQLFALGALLTWLPRGRFVSEVYSSAGLIVPGTLVRLTDHLVLSPAAAWLVYLGLLLGLLLTLHGRYARAGLLAFLVGSLTLLFHEGLWFKAYDRMLLWQTVVLLAAPGGGDGRQEGSPLARYWMILVYCNLYGATGFNKLLHEPSWLVGAPLANFFVSNTWGGRPLGVWLSDQPAALTVMGLWTLAFECLFPLLIWSRRASPWLLIAGALMHLGILFTLRVNTFSFISVAAYPILLHPDARWPWAEAWAARRARAAGG